MKKMKGDSSIKLVSYSEPGAVQVYADNERYLTSTRVSHIVLTLPVHITLRIIPQQSLKFIWFNFFGRWSLTMSAVLEENTH